MSITQLEAAIIEKKPRKEPVPPVETESLKAESVEKKHKIPDYCSLGRAVVATEAQAIQDLEMRINDQFVHACQILIHCQGRIIVTGMGKSGHIGNKIAATLASTGSPAFFVHPGEASHGDLGMITRKDVVLALSNSGETDELITILPLIKRLKVPLIALTGNSNSRLAQAAEVHLDVSVAKEACPLGLAPTASTTATLVMGDALAIALLQTRGFTAEDFAFSHPGGRLGRRLLLHIDDVMHKGEQLPMVTQGVPLRDALVEMTRKGLGITAVVDAQHRLQGVFTDGDLRRTLEKGYDFRDVKIEEVMTRQCCTVAPGILAAEALQIMEDREITVLMVVDPKTQRLQGAVHMYRLLEAGVA